MSFDVAIYNAGCNDGNRVIRSIKAAYLYADNVRVYDILYSEEFEELLIANEKKRKHREAIDYDVLGISTRMITNEQYFMASDSYSYEIENMHYFRQSGNLFYNKMDYLHNMLRLGVELITPEVDVLNIEKINDVFSEYVSKCEKDTGFKLFNSYPKKIRTNLPKTSVIFTSHLSEYAISNLPGFEMATIDEIIDIRKELNQYIIPYRTSALRMAQFIKEIPDNESLQREVISLYFREIEPKVAEINAAIKDNNIFKNIAKSVITDDNAWLGIGALVAAITTSGDIANAIGIGTAVALGGASLSKGIVRTIEESNKIKTNEMFFLYEVGKKLRNPKPKKDLRDVTGLPD